MEPVRQEDRKGCGVACVAFIVGKSYQQTKEELFENKEKATYRGYTCKELVEALSKAGLSYKYCYIKCPIRYKDLTIVFIKRSKRYPHGHYLVKTKKGWMDPWINFPEEKSVKNSKAGFRKRLPGKAIYAIIPINNNK